MTSQRSIPSLLLVEDNAGDARLLREMFKEYGLHDTEVTQAGCMGEAEELLAKHSFSIVLLDLGLPDAQGLDTVRRGYAAAPHVALVVLTGLEDESLAVQTLQEGAQDYLIKGQIDPRGLMRALRHAIERKSMEEALFVERQRAQVTLDSIGEGVVCTDIVGRITFLNPVAARTTGWTSLEAAGRPLEEVLRIVDAASHEVVASPMDRTVGRNRALNPPSNSILIRRDGIEVAIEDSAAAIHDPQGRVTGAVIVFRDVSVARATALQVTHLAEHDYLTGLPNRMLLNDRIGQAIALAARDTTKVAVLFLDLDGFKHTNDSLGHLTGDKLLQSIAERLVECVRTSDTVSRQGGDEFVVLLPVGDQPEDAAIAARRILNAVAGTHRIGERDLHITTSIGVSVYPDDGLDAETLIKNADTAMYQAKEDGRQGFRFFKPEMNVRAIERQSIEEGLRRALDQQGFELHYQPKINLKSGEIVGSEALIRWTDSTRGSVSPVQFIPIAEDSGLILPIGNWVLRTACAQARAWTDAGLRPGTIAVNVSARELWNEKFLEGLFATLADTGLDPRLLVLELTESILMDRVELSAKVLRTLRERGIKVAIDDFGTGYSSLSYLRKLPVDSLKIDQSFVREITTDPEAATMVTAVLSMARSLKLRVVAEGVETREELEFLQAHQCDEAQGYYFSRPVPPEAFARLIETGTGVSSTRFNLSASAPNFRQPASDLSPEQRSASYSPVPT